MIAPPDLPPPSAPRRPQTLDAHGAQRVDEYWWLRDRHDAEVVAYLTAENAYADAVLAPYAGLTDRLFEEIKARIQEDDVSVPARNGPWWYWTKTAEGEQYATYCRLADPQRSLEPRQALEAASRGEGEVVLDENALAEGHDFFSLGVFDLSLDHRLLAYALDTDGSEVFTLRFRDLDTGRDLDDVIEGVYYGSAWADGATFFYVRPDDAMRPHQVWRHRIGSPADDDVLVYEDPDERFFVSVGLTRSERFVVVQSESKMTSESHWIATASPEAAPNVVLGRRQGIEYDIDHAVLPGAGDVWLVRSNEPDADGTPSTNFALRTIPLDASQGEVLVEHRSEVMLESVDAFAHHLVLVERAEGLERLRILNLAADGERAEHLVEQPDPVYSLTGGVNPEWEARSYRFGYTSLITPVSTIDYDPLTGRRDVIKVQPVLGGYRPEEFRSERIWASAPDGTQVPISLVCRADQALDGTAPALLYGYGSYEITIDPVFSPSRLNLLERGVVFAIAHIRGGGEMGRRWYEEGRLAAKANTFTDFVACAEHLVAEGYAAPDRLAIRGGSAGGLLMGAVTNLRPDLFAAVVAEVPFVDVVTTMSDDSLPLTVTEWEEWGNPVADAEAYATMLAYSPYDNVVPADYPAMYVTAGLNDPRVSYWEPAKWVAKLRVADTGDRPILLRTEMGAGHQGPSGRYEAWRDEARVQTFLLVALDVPEGSEPLP